MNPCSECGALNIPEAKFCQFCSAPLVTAGQEQGLEEELARRRRDLAMLEERAAKFGIDVPLHLVSQIAEERIRISEIEKRLSSVEGESSLAAQYFSKATEAFVTGDLWEARRYYSMTLDEDPSHPRASAQLALVQSQIEGARSPFIYPRYPWLPTSFWGYSTCLGSIVAFLGLVCLFVVLSELFESPCLGGAVLLGLVSLLIYWLRSR
jgi:hypothetical protein